MKPQGFSLPYLAYALLLLAFGYMLYNIWYSSREFDHINSVHAQQFDQIEDFTQDVIESHLWLAKYLTPPYVSQHLQRYEDLNDSVKDRLKNLGLLVSNHEKDFPRTQKVSQQIGSLKMHWMNVSEFARQRIADPAHAGTNSPLDEQYDVELETALHIAAGIEHELRLVAAGEAVEFERNRYLLLGSAVFMMFVALGFLGYIDRGRRRNIELALRATQQSRDSESRFRGLVEQSPFSIQVFDVDGRSIQVNKAWEALWGVPGEYIKDYNVLQDQQLIDKGVMPFMLKAFAGEACEIPPLNYNPAENDGLVGPPCDRMVRAFMYPVNDSAGLVREVIVMHEDVTEKMQVEREMQRNRKNLAEAQRVAGIGSWELDLASGTLSWSDEVFRIFDIDGGKFDASYQAFLELIHPEDRQWVADAFTRHIEQGEPYDVEHRLLFADGRTKYVHERCETERDARGAALRSLGTVQDITARVMAGQENERQREKMEHVQRLESLGVLAGGIAHDFNNLLTAIMGHAALARQQIGPMDRVGESLGCIEDASRKAADLCRQMLAYSGKGKFVVQPINLSELVREMSRLLHVSINKGAALREELADDLPSIEADVAQMQQVVMNLVINAGEAIGESGGSIVIATGVMQVDADYLHTVYVEEEGLEPGRYVYLEVTDNGCGMDAQTRKHLFEPFFTTKFTGRGLGMSAIIGIVRGHKGAVKVYSELGKGTTFKVLLPMVGRQAVSLAVPVMQMEIPEDAGTVLVVDDEESIRTVACLILEHAGFKTLQAEDGIEAVEMLRRHAGEVDVVLLDMTMPRMGGEEAFTEMRSIKPGIRVVLSSGYNQQTATQRFTGKGLAGFVQKPYTPDLLLAALLKVLEAQVADDIS